MIRCWIDTEFPPNEQHSFFAMDWRILSVSLFSESTSTSDLNISVF